jgi:dihydrodipicolinate synthase/N-acetylneuraminate lyase
MNHFCGILPAVVSLFGTDGNFAAEAFERLLARIYGAGVHGITFAGRPAKASCSRSLRPKTYQ